MVYKNCFAMIFKTKSMKELTTIKIVGMLLVIAIIFNGGQLAGQNKIVFTDSDVNHRHHLPPDSPLRKVDHNYKGSVEKIDEYGLNSVYNEHGPLVEPGGGRLFFSRSLHPGNVGGLKDNEDIWVATWDKISHNWSRVERMPAPLNTLGPNFITSISVEDGVITMILGNSYEDGEISGEGLSFSELENGVWSDPVNFTIKGAKNKSKNVDFFVSEDGRYMLFSAEMDDSKGGRDIYMSHRVDKRTWDTPVNLQSLNTPGEETSPSFSPDGRFLFFSSDGLDGFGKLDIFFATRTDDSWEKWSEPANLGSQFNDAQDNKHFSMPPAGEKIYFVSESEQGNTDIYSFATSTEELYAELTGEPICLAERVFIDESSFSHLLECNICVDLEYESGDTGNSNVKYRWNYGDGFSEEGLKVSHCYDVHGNYDIKLSIVETSSDKVISEIDHFYELNEFMELKVDAVETGVINEELQFSSHLAGGYPANVEYYWDFGDGYFACGNQVSHTYIRPNDYVVRSLVSFEWQGRVRYLMTEHDISVNMKHPREVVTSILK